MLQTCVVANIRDTQLEYYDSLGSVDSSTTESILRWVDDEYRSKYSSEPSGKFDVCPFPSCSCNTLCHLST
jgi:hypothetical protein